MTRRFHAPLVASLLLAAAAGGAVVRVAGLPAPAVGTVGEGGPASEAALNNAEDVEVGPDGDIYIADRNSQRLLRISDGILDVAYRGDFAAGENDVSAVAIGDDGTLYFTNGQAVLSLAQEGTVEEVAPLPQPGQANSPKLAVVENGLLVAQGRIPRIDLIASDGTVTLVAGADEVAVEAESGDGGPAGTARFGSISDIAVDSTGVVYVADEGFGDVRMIDVNGDVSTVFGAGIVPINQAVDGTLAEDVDYGAAEIGVAVDKADRLYIVPRLSGKVFRIEDGVITTVAGGGPNPGDGSEPLDTQLQAPFRIAFAEEDLLVLVEDGRFLLLAPGVATSGNLVGSVPSPGDINLDPIVVATSIALTAGILFLIPFPAELFNNTLAEHHEEVKAWFRKRRSERSGPWSRPWVIVAGMAVMAILCGFLDPGFLAGTGSLPTFAGLLVGIVVTTFGFLLPTMIMRRARTGDSGRLALLPVALVVAVACVLLSRMVGFLPGYLYGIALGLFFAHDVDERDESNEVLVSSLVLLVVAVGSWFGLGSVRNAGPGVWVTIAEAALAMTTVAAFEGLVFGLLPIQGMPGRVMLSQRRLIWLLVWGIAILAFFHVLVNPQSGYLVDSALVPTATTYGLLALFSLVSVGLWLWFRRGDRRTAAPGIEPG